MQITGRFYNGSVYRYGFQGQEKDNEIKGEGNSLNYTFRMHDPRIGRFFAPDPLERSYPYYSPYAFSGNRVIDMSELEGLETGNPAIDLIWLNLWGYCQSLKVRTQEGTNDLIQGGTRSNEYINENPTYSQQYKDQQHDLQKLKGVLTITTAAIDPAVQTMNFVSPVDDLITVGSGYTVDNFEFRKATTIERVFAGVEVAAFAFDVSAFAKPVKSIISKTAEKNLEYVSAEIVEQAVKSNPKGLQAIKEAIQKLPTMDRASIAKAIEDNIPSLQYKGGSPDGRFMRWESSGGIEVKIHPADEVSKYDHIHINDSKGNSLDISLEVKSNKSSDVHIPINPKM